MSEAMRGFCRGLRGEAQQPRPSIGLCGFFLAAIVPLALLAAEAHGQARPGSTPAPVQAPASPPVATPPPVAAEPQETSATYGDWSLRCIRQGEGAQARRNCEVVQTLRQQGQTQPFAQVALGRPEPGRGMRMVVLLPPNVAFPSTVKVAAAEGQPPLLELAWRRCLPNACVADAEMAAPTLTQLRAWTEAGRLTFQNGLGREVTVPFSLRGLPQALDALAKEG